MSNKASNGNGLAELERRLWSAADQLWANSPLRPSEYSTPVLGLIFLRFADSAFTKAEAELLNPPSPPGRGQGEGAQRWRGIEGEGAPRRRRTIGKTDYQAKGVVYIPTEARFSRLLQLPESADIGKKLNEAMKAIEQENDDLMIRALQPPVDISGVMQQIEGVLDQSIGTSGYTIKEGAKPLDLSRIDFDALRKFFKRAHKRAEIERLRAAITAKLQAMLAQNRTRIDFLEKFQELIDKYNAGSANVEAIFEELLKFAKKLNEEEQRHVREQMTEEELAIFDILTKPRVDITAKEEKQVKKVAKDMLLTLKAKALVLDWRKRQQTRAAVRLCIEEWLDKLPPVYTSAIYQTKCDAVYQHVYDMYTGGVAG